MNDAMKIVATGVVILAAGFAMGRLSAPAKSVAPAADEGHRGAPRAPERSSAVEPMPPRALRPATPLRCQDAEIELRFLKAGREAKQAREQEIRRSFEDGTALEEAMRWMTLAEQVVAECLPKSSQLSFMECSEYPCVAALAGPAGASTLARDELEFTATAALESCTPLVDVFGEDYPLDAALFLPFPVSCPDGDDEHAWLLLVLDPEGDAFHDLQADPDDRLEAERINRWIYRRAHDVDRKWLCEGEPAP